jgi:hypothetical protein
VYLCGDPSEAGVEDVAAHIEDHSASERGWRVGGWSEGWRAGTHGRWRSLYSTGGWKSAGEKRHIVIPSRRTSPNASPPIRIELGKAGVQGPGSYWRDVIGGAKVQGLCGAMVRWGRASASVIQPMPGSCANG